MLRGELGKLGVKESAPFYEITRVPTRPGVLELASALALALELLKEADEASATEVPWLPDDVRLLAARAVLDAWLAGSTSSTEEGTKPTTD